LFRTITVNNQLSAKSIIYNLDFLGYVIHRRGNKHFKLKKIRKETFLLLATKLVNCTSSCCCWFCCCWICCWRNSSCRWMSLLSFILLSAIIYIVYTIVSHNLLSKDIE